MTSDAAHLGPVVVTGGTGFVGAHLVRRLAAEGREVHVLGRPATDRWRLAGVAGRVRHHAVDLAERSSRATLAPLLCSLAPTLLFHLAAASLVAGAGSPADTMIAVNVLGTHAVVEAAATVAGCRVVTTADAFEHNDLGRPLCEADAAGAHPTTLHGITRLVATRAAQRTGAATGLPVVTVRLFSVFGPLDHPRRLVPRLFEAARTGAPVHLSDPGVVRDWVNVDDVVELYLRVADPSADVAGAGGEQVFNAGSGVATSLGQLVATIEEVTGRKIDARWGSIPLTEHDHGHWVADQTHTRTSLGWAATPLYRALDSLTA